jgi:PAS domain S-box-containing protein
MTALTLGAIALGALLGLAVGVAVMRRDRRQAHQAAARREATLRTVLAASPEIIAVLGPDGRVRSLSPAARRVLGIRPEDRTGRSAFDPALLHPHDREAFARAQQRVLSGEDGEATMRLRVRHSNGRWVALETHLLPLGAGGGAVVVTRDLTGREALEEELRQARLQAGRANHAKSQYLSRMSHELRTPLNAILGFAQLLDLDHLNDEQRDSVRQILSGARHLLGLINEVLDIAAIEAGKLPLSLEPVDVNEVVGEAADLVRPLADQRGILLVAAVHTCNGHVRADRQRIRQILLNLLTNAVERNREGGSVHVVCEQAAEERLRIIVTDTGPGIAPEPLELLFAPFERQAQERHVADGSGLGLSLSKRLAEAMGGALDATTTLGQGGTFWVELPVAESPAERAARDQRTAEERDDEELGAVEPEMTVLCIEDNLSNLQLIERVLARRPRVRLISAMRPNIGLDLADEYRPDLVLLDLHLPDMPGTEVLRRLRAGARTSHIPVVILTADARPGLVTELLDQGARAFLTKPLDVKELLELLDTIANERDRAGSPSPSP